MSDRFTNKSRGLEKMFKDLRDEGQPRWKKRLRGVAKFAFYTSLAVGASVAAVHYIDSANAEDTNLEIRNP